MAGYGDFEDFAIASTFPRDATMRLQATYPGFVDARIALHSAAIDAQLAKRYLTPFEPDTTGGYPLIVVSWVYTLTSLDCWLKLGRAATDQDFQQYVDAARAANEQIQAASDSVAGLWSLPLRADNPASGIVRPSVLSYTEVSPFLGQRTQRDRGRQDDQRGSGTYRGGRYT